MKRQEELLIAGGEEVGNGRAKGLSAIGGGEQAATSLMPYVGVMPVSFFWKFTTWGLLCGGLTVIFKMWNLPDSNLYLDSVFCLYPDW